VQTRGEKKYYITFIDICTIYCYTYVFRNKYEALEMFKYYKNKLDKKIKVSRSDRDGEYEAFFGEFYSQNSIIYQNIVSYSPQ